MSKKIINLGKFTPKGTLGQLFQKARVLNYLNEQLSEYLPEYFTSLSLCVIENNTITFVTDNQAIIFRAKKQNDILLNAIRQIELLTHIETVIIKVDLKGSWRKLI